MLFYHWRERALSLAKTANNQLTFLFILFYIEPCRYLKHCLLLNKCYPFLPPRPLFIIKSSNPENEDQKLNYKMVCINKPKLTKNFLMKFRHVMNNILFVSLTYDMIWWWLQIWFRIVISQKGITWRNTIHTWQRVLHKPHSSAHIFKIVSTLYAITTLYHFASHIEFSVGWKNYILSHASNTIWFEEDIFTLLFTSSYFLFPFFFFVHVSWKWMTGITSWFLLRWHICVTWWRVIRVLCPLLY